MNDLQEKINLYNDFLNTWSVEKLENITLEEYTNTSDLKDSFTYAIENRMRYLGSIKGVNSFIFGIYKRENKKDRESINQYYYAQDYAWYKRYGEDKEIVFEKVKEYVNNVIKYAQDGNYKAIDDVDLPNIYKWKIAFHYQNSENIGVIPIFTETAIINYLKDAGKYKENMSRADMYKAIKENEKVITIKDAILAQEKIWNAYRIFNPDIEQENIEHNDDLPPAKKSSSTSSLDNIKYIIKEHTIIRRTLHNALEKSFKKFLETKLNATNIIQDEDCIDFQFELNGNKYICELKPSDNQKEIKYAIQNAVGQIIRYSFIRQSSYKVIVFQKEPKKENLALLEYIKNEHKIFYLYEDKKGVFFGNLPV